MVRWYRAEVRTRFQRLRRQCLARPGCGTPLVALCSCEGPPAWCVDGAADGLIEMRVAEAGRTSEQQKRVRGSNCEKEVPLCSPRVGSANNAEVHNVGDSPVVQNTELVVHPRA